MSDSVSWSLGNNKQINKDGTLTYPSQVSGDDYYTSVFGDTSAPRIICDNSQITYSDPVGAGPVTSLTYNSGGCSYIGPDDGYYIDASGNVCLGTDSTYGTYGYGTGIAGTSQQYYDSLDANSKTLADKQAALQGSQIDNQKTIVDTQGEDMETAKKADDTGVGITANKLMELYGKGSWRWSSWTGGNNKEAIETYKKLSKEDRDAVDARIKLDSNGELDLAKVMVGIGGNSIFGWGGKLDETATTTADNTTSDNTTAATA